MKAKHVIMGKREVMVLLTENNEKNSKRNMTIREYTVNEDKIKKLYTSVGWSAYTNDMPAFPMYVK